MLGEVTMVQFYGVALTAGKAHRDHKHHHAHQYDHNGTPITTTATPPPQPRPTLPTHPLLTAGQINPNLRLNFAGGQPQPKPQMVPGRNFNAQFMNGQFVGSLVSQQLGRGPPQRYYSSQSSFPSYKRPLSVPQRLTLSKSPIISGGLVHPSLVNPANVQFIDNTHIELDTHQLFRRHNSDETAASSEEKTFGEKITPKKEKRTAKEVGPVEQLVEKKEEDETEVTPDNKHKKRELLLAGGHLFDDSLLGGGGFDKSILIGLAGIGQNEPILQKQKQSEEREPAEAEVKAVMNICSGCDEEPFGKALIFGWRTVPMKLYSGAFFTPATQQCKAF